MAARCTMLLCSARLRHRLSSALKVCNTRAIHYFTGECSLNGR